MNTRPFIAATLVAASVVGCHDQVDSPTEPSAMTAAAQVTLAFRQITAGEFHTCGVTLGNQVYCWGNNGVGQLGLGWASIGVAIPRPVLVVGGLQFRQISAGSEYTCGVTTDSLAYCWGRNTSGQLGDGTATDRSTPTPVSGGRRFRQVDAANSHTCGVTSTKRAYCWGKNDFGQLGDGTTLNRLSPVAVAGGRRFRQVAAGGDYWSHTCGVTTEDLAFCWGSNSYGQVGDSTEVGQRPSPTRVAGGRRYRQVDAGSSHSCAVTLGNRAYCWGYGGGSGKTYLKRFWPTAVTGGLNLARVTAGDHHTCGESLGNTAYCWGIGEFGQLGDGSFNSIRYRATEVIGGLTFSQLSAGSTHTCGKTPENVAYCWGNNYNGALGDGTYEHRLTPTRVLGPT